MTGKASTILVVPIRAVFLDPKISPRRRNAPEVLALKPNGDHPGPLVLGIFHTNVELTQVRRLDEKIRDRAAAVAGRLGQVPGALPPTYEGNLPPDTYVLGLAHGRIGVYRGNLDFVANVDFPSAVDRVLGPNEVPPASTVTVDPDTDRIQCSFWLPIGGKNLAPGKGITFTWSMRAAKGQVRAAGLWR